MLALVAHQAGIGTGTSQTVTGAAETLVVDFDVSTAANAGVADVV